MLLNVCRICSCYRLLLNSNKKLGEEGILMIKKNFVLKLLVGKERCVWKLSYTQEYHLVILVEQMKMCITCLKTNLIQVFLQSRIFHQFWGVVFRGRGLIITILKANISRQILQTGLLVFLVVLSERSRGGFIIFTATI